MSTFFFFFVSSISILVSVRICIGASDTMLAGQSLFPNRSLISGGGMFELGFFSPGNSSHYYVGIWYKYIPGQTVVWVANRNNPIPHSLYNNSRLHLSEDGNLQIIVLSDLIWDAEVSNAKTAILLDNGNFELVDDERIIYRSIDFPTDTWLPTGYLGFDLLTGRELKLISWKNKNDPSWGNYSLGMEPHGGDSGLFIKSNDSVKLWRSGFWREGSLGSLPTVSSIRNSNNFTYVSSDNLTWSLQYNSVSEPANSRIILTHDGQLIHFRWSVAAGTWNVLWEQPSDDCKSYAFCGANAICDVSAVPVCSCLPGYVPRVEQAWNSLNFSDGCKREKPESCDRDGFTKVAGVRLPAYAEPLPAVKSGICEFSCSEKCSCLAYAYSTAEGCSIFKWGLLDMERLPNNSAGSDIHIKIANASVSRQHAQGNKIELRLALGLGISFGVVFVLCCILFCYFWLRRKSKVPQPGPDFAHQNLLLLDLNSNGPENKARHRDRSNIFGEDKNSKYELPTFSFSSIAAATDDFSMANKLGQGGFGPVYKGKSLNGQFVAVKRLSRRSGQGLEEFKNETELIAKLQHRNLVGILGCCIENDEKILVYEYMPNKSLDFLLFDSTRKELLDWGRRIHIIEGIAQGLLYLHQHSRLRIIHRDLKAGNILLDAEMNPKISDFGLARIFGGTDLQANTKRIVGTYGYMSPEYAMKGIFSIKSDVYAFGVLLLEIISGKKNTGFHSSERLSLLEYAWNLWTNNRGIELIDPALEIHSSSSCIPLRYIQIGLLCVQDDPGDRPVMSDVVAMLSKEQVPLASPKHSVLPLGITFFEASPGENEVEMCSVNELTITLIDAR